MINKAGKRAYVQNFVSRNVSVVDLTTDKVLKTISTAPLPAPGSVAEQVAVGAEVFFSSRGNFAASARPQSSERLSSEGWQSCASCHFKGLTDGVIWTFNAGPRKSVPLNATFDPRNRSLQRILNYSAIFDEVAGLRGEHPQRLRTGPAGRAGGRAPRSRRAASAQDPAHGLLIGDNGAPDCAPCVINTFAKPNAGRPQWNVTLPGSTRADPRARRAQRVGALRGAHAEGAVHDQPAARPRRVRRARSRRAAGSSRPPAARAATSDRRSR